MRFRLIAAESMSLDDLVVSNFLLWIYIYPPTIPDRHPRMRSRRGGSQGPSWIGFIKNEENSHIGFWDNDGVWEADKGTLNGACGRGFFNMILMKTVMTTPGGDTNHHWLSWRHPIKTPTRRRAGHARGKRTPKREVFGGEDAGGRRPKIRFFWHTYIIEEKVNSPRHKIFGGGGGWGRPLLRCLPNISQDLSLGGGGFI